MDITRILKNIIVNSNGCWIWQKSKSSAGYGQLTEKHKYWSAHRYALSCKIGELKSEDIVRHLCHNPSCCNPDHLAVGTYKDNWNDSESKHRSASRSRRKEWIVEGVTYNTIREAVRETGLSMSALKKHTNSVTRVFDTKAYRCGCEQSKRWRPKL